MAKTNPSVGSSGGKGKQQMGGGQARGGAAGRNSGSAQASRGGMSAGAGKSGQKGTQKGSQQGERATGTPDEHYNLVSVLYHSLKGAQIYAQYTRDAEEAGDTELASFLREVQVEEQRRAERAKALLVGRVGGGMGLGDDEEA